MAKPRGVLKAFATSKTDDIQVLITPPVLPSRGDLEELAMGEAEALVQLGLLEQQQIREARIAAVQEQAKEGVKGVCYGCDVTIPAARMKAFPEGVATCVKCQRQLERTGQAAEPSASFM